MPKLTTQQVADLLGASRPTVVRLIDEGELASERIGNRRKVLLKDALANRDARRRRQYQAIADTSVDFSEDEPADVVAERLARVRKVRAEHRQRAGTPSERTGQVHGTEESLTSRSQPIEA